MFLIVSLDVAVHTAAAVSVQRTQPLRDPEQRPTPALEGPAPLCSMELRSNKCV